MGMWCVRGQSIQQTLKDRLESLSAIARRGASAACPDRRARRGLRLDDCRRSDSSGTARHRRCPIIPSWSARNRARPSAPGSAMTARTRRLLAFIDDPAPPIPPSRSNSKPSSRRRRMVRDLRRACFRALTGAPSASPAMVREITEQKKHAQPALLSRDRDELTGHLNRTRLRDELTRVIDEADAESRTCAFARRRDRQACGHQRNLRFRCRRRSDRRHRPAASRNACAAPTSSAAPPATNSASSWANAASAKWRSSPSACTPPCASERDRNACGLGVGDDLDRRGVAAVRCRHQPGSDAARRRSAGTRAQRWAATALPSMPSRPQRESRAPPPDDHRATK